MSEQTCSLSLNISSENPVQIRKSDLRKKVAIAKGTNQIGKDIFSASPKVIGEFDSGLDSYIDDRPDTSDIYRRNSVRTVIERHKVAKNHSRNANQSFRRSRSQFEKPSPYPQPKWQHSSSLFHSNPVIPHINGVNEKGTSESLFSAKLFSDLQIHPHLVSCLQSRFKIDTMTNVQASSIPVILSGKDVLVKSCTGSGKTLAFAVPITQKLQEIKPNITRSDGVYALIILPTRELVLQSFDCFSKLTKAFTWIVPGYLIGGEKKKSEKSRIRKGINILITTPGRLLDHVEHTSNLSLGHVEWLVIDEADRLLEQGFEEAVLKILSHFNVDDVKPVKRHTILLSATLSKGVDRLAGMSLQDPVYIDISSTSGDDFKLKNFTAPSQLKQYVTVIPTKLRLVTLSAFILEKCAKGNVKALVFMCTQSLVDFHFILFNNAFRARLMEKDYKVKFFKLHGSMSQEDRTAVFHQFSSADGGILLCTDVAARGLDLPEVNWIIQYNVPISVECYVHRVGRTARIGKDGQSLLFLIPSEIQFMSLLQEQQLNLQEIHMEEILPSLLLLEESGGKVKQQNESRAIENLATSLQLKFEEFIYSENTLHKSASEAYLTYIKAYSSYPRQMRSVIPFRMLHLGHAAKSFCLQESPTELGYRHRPPSGKPAFTDKIVKRKAIVAEFGSGFISRKEKNDDRNNKRNKELRNNDLS